MRHPLAGRAIKLSKNMICVLLIGLEGSNLACYLFIWYKFTLRTISKRKI